MVSSQRTPPPHSNQSSHFWRNICKLWDSARCQIKWYPGNGENIRFWSDFWVGDHGPFHLVSHAKISEYEKARPISDFFDEHGWKWDLFAHLLPLTFSLPSGVLPLNSLTLSPLAIGVWSTQATSSHPRPIRVLSWLTGDITDPFWGKLWKLPMA